MFCDEITFEDAIWKAKTQKGETYGMLWRQAKLHYPVRGSVVGIYHSD
jgi:hypothetical protein